MDQAGLAERIQARVRPSLTDTIAIIESLTSAPPRQHPLGFVYWQQPFSSGSSLRAHLWLDRSVQRDDGLSSVHDHVYDLSSLVVYGVIRNTVFAVERATSGQQVVTVDPASHEVRPEADGASFDAIALEQSTHGAGSIYSIPRGTFHSSDAISSPALTLVANSPGSGRPRVVTAGTGDVRSVEREAAIGRAWRYSLKRILDELGRHSTWPSEVAFGNEASGWASSSETEAR